MVAWRQTLLEKEQRALHPDLQAAGRERNRETDRETEPCYVVQAIQLALP